MRPLGHLKLIALVFGLFTLIAISPFFTSMVDMYWWFWFDHTLSGINYSTGRPILLLVCCLLTFIFGIITWITLEAIEEFTKINNIRSNRNKDEE